MGTYAEPGKNPRPSGPSHSSAGTCTRSFISMVNLNQTRAGIGPALVFF